MEILLTIGIIWALWPFIQLLGEALRPAPKKVNRPPYEDLDNKWRVANGYEALTRSQADLHAALKLTAEEHGGVWLTEIPNPKADRRKQLARLRAFRAVGR